MAKVVYNSCYGGFSVSEAGMRRYCEIKGIPLWVERGKFGLNTYWIVPPHDRPDYLDGDAFHAASMEERKASNERYRQSTLHERDFARHDPALVQVVEELGAEASGRFAKLAIEEVPDGTAYRIDEYDGYEAIVTDTEQDWIVAA